jgi:ABC-2 type transport system ATP-binding protein
MILVRNLSKNYGNFQALTGLNFEVDEGDIVAFLGPNGAGKTTTMRIITGFLAPTAGEVLIDGLDVIDEGIKVKAMTGYLPEVPPLYPELTVREYLAFVAAIKGVPLRMIPGRIEDVMKMTDLYEIKDTMIGLLSKGFKQRVGIAQSIVNSPKVIIMDEPTVGLDPVQVVEIRTLIKRLAKQEKRTVILSTHLLAEAEEICEKAVIIHNGRIVAVDTIDNLKQREINELSLFVKVRKDPEALQGFLSKIKGIVSVEAENSTIKIRTSEDVREEIASLIVNRGFGLLEMSVQENSLEDVFIKLVR